jgi:hypothetical protein
MLTEKKPMRTQWIALLALIAFTATSDASPGAACAKLCRKVSSCRLITYDLCMDMCGDQRSDTTPEGRASTLAQANLSCAALANQMAPSEWLCTAEGATSAGYSNGDKDTRGVRMLGTGRTRSAAVYKAISNCNSVLTMQLSLEYAKEDSDSLGTWEAARTSDCHITQCIAPASARKRQR